MLADNKTITLILIEDGIFNLDSDYDLLPQRDLIQNIKSAGIKIVSIDNHAMTSSGFEILQKLTSKIKKLNKTQVELTLIP